MIMPLKNKFVVWSPKSLDLGVSNFFKSWSPKSKGLGLQLFYETIKIYRFLKIATPAIPILLNIPNSSVNSSSFAISCIRSNSL